MRKAFVGISSNTYPFAGSQNAVDGCLVGGLQRWFPIYWEYLGIIIPSDEYFVFWFAARDWSLSSHEMKWNENGYIGLPPTSYIATFLCVDCIAVSSRSALSADPTKWQIPRSKWAVAARYRNVGCWLVCGWTSTLHIFRIMIVT